MPFAEIHVVDERTRFIEDVHRSFLSFDVPPGAVPLPMLDLQPSAVPGVEAYPGTRAMA